MSTQNKRVLVLHAYSAQNAGDGLLVEETLKLIRDALGEAEVTLLASRPDSFAHHGIRVLPTVPTKVGWDRRTLHELRTINSYDLVIGVGGGYLRTGAPLEATKTALVMGPQLLAASRTSAPTIYLPQSIGPARFGTRRALKRLLHGIDVVMVRDDRSLREMTGPTLVRIPDLATAAVGAGRQQGQDIDPIPVVSIRAVRKQVPAGIYDLCGRLREYDGYVQSTVGGNDDRPAMSTLSPRNQIERSTLMTPGGTPRVIIAVRLHAALMALAAGHYVIHLAYERKGFGAFGDLGLQRWVHSVNNFDPSAVAQEVDRLLGEKETRRAYDDAIAASRRHLNEARDTIVTEIRARTGTKNDGPHR